MAKKNNQSKIIDIIIKLNPAITVGDAAKAYKILKQLGETNVNRNKK